MSTTDTISCQEHAEIDVRQNSWPSDSTSIQEVRIVLEQDNGSALGDEDLFGRIQGFVDLEDAQWGNQDLDGVSAELLKFYQATNKFFNQNDALRTRYLIMVGLVLRRVKQVVRDNDEKWETWIETRMGSQVRRSVGDYMSLAGVGSIQSYAYLGKARLMKIAAAVRAEIKQGDSDPIGDFLRSANITFDPQADEEISLDETQVEIDTELLKRRLDKEDLQGLSREKLKAMAEGKIDLTLDMTRALKQVKAADGDTSQLLSDILDRKGKLPDEYQKAMLPEHFNSRGKSLKKAVEGFIDDATLLAAVDQSILDSLIESLTDLKSKVEAVETVQTVETVENDQESSS